MQFKVIENRKGDKVLSISGFKRIEQDAFEGYGSENDDKNQDQDQSNQKEEDDNILFINLNRLLDQQKELD